jgi:HEAT repeat protein
MAALSPARLTKARGSYFVFNVLNSLSFVFLSGSFVTLFALRLGATNATVGALNALSYATFFFLPVGKALVRRFRIVGVFGWAWVARYLAMVPALAAPFFAAGGEPGAALGLILASTAGFHIARGVGLIGNNPVLVSLADGGGAGKDRGAFLQNVHIIGSIASTLTSLAAALVLGRSASARIYAFAMGAGIAIGLLGTAFFFKTPEPERYKPKEGASLWKTTVEAFRDSGFRRFIEVFLLLSMIAGMARSFLPVYAKEVFGQGDDAVMVYSLLGSIGAIAMGFLSRLLVDRLGAKPLYVIFTAISALSLVPVLAAPGPLGPLASPLFAAAFLGLLNFVSGFGFIGEENAAQTYFFTLVKPERTLDLGVAYFLAYGLGGALGAGAGGFLLDALEAFGLGPGAAYRAFYGLLFALMAVVMLRMGRLTRLGSASVRTSLGVMLSIRDLRAFDLLARLDKIANPEEEARLIHEIGSSASPHAQDDLVECLSSPRLEVRMEALIALEKLPGLTDKTGCALIAEVERHPYTTAYVAARILGKAGLVEALPSLRKATDGQDYMLQANAAVALARLGDVGSIGSIEALLEMTDNPRVRISCAYALEVMGSRSSVPAIIGCLRKKDPPPFVSDELVLSAASILGLLPRFYTMYAAFLEDEGRGLALLGDAATERFGEPVSAAEGGGPQKRRAAGRGARGRKAGEVAAAAEPVPAASPRKAFDAALASILADPADGAPMGRFILLEGLGSGISDPAAADQSAAADLVLAEAALDPYLGYRGFRFFIAAYAALKAT